MAVKVADTIKAMSNTFPVAECVDIDVNINGTTKRLQKAIDDGEIGGGSDSTWKGTHEEWEALSTEEKGKYEIVCFTNDYDSSGIGGGDTTWKGTHEEWDTLLPSEKQKYVIVYFTDDYDGSGDGTGSIDDTNASVNTTYSSSKVEEKLSTINNKLNDKLSIKQSTTDSGKILKIGNNGNIEFIESDSTWKGTHEEWEALSTEEKGKYEIVCFTNDYDSSGIDKSDSIWKGTRDEWEALSPTDKEKYVIVYFTDDYDGTDSTGLIDDSIISNKTTYSSSKIENSLSKKANTTDLTVHTSDTNIHVTTSDKTKWNNSVNKTDIVDNLTSTNTDKPLSANQGKILKGEVDNKANATDLTTHTGNTGVHITTAERTKWNKVDNKVDKTDIVDNLTSTNTNKPLSANQGKILNDKKLNKADVNKFDDLINLDSVSLKEYILENCTEEKVYHLIARSACTDIPKDNAHFYVIVEKVGSFTHKVTAKCLNTNEEYTSTYRSDSSTWYGWDKIALGDYNLKTYTDINQLGLTAPVTVGEIFNAMPNFSLLRFQVDNYSVTDAPAPNGILIIDKIRSAKFSIEFKISADGTVAQNSLYIGQLKGSDASGLTWRRVCTTSVADVGVTIITPTFPSTVTLGKTNITRYSIKNGWANVTIIMNLIASPKLDWTSITTELPKPDKEVHVAYCGETGINNTNVAFRLKVNGSLDMLVSSEITKSDWWNLSFSYPVAEE